jgi:hypothetical protein
MSFAKCATGESAECCLGGRGRADDATRGKEIATNAWGEGGEAGYKRR